ncbi:MAG: hypothetical protein OEW77_06390 [Gemmatimonadota bacterium]|nr:hypothetical protein [Gemmatimonadota bacterium]
MTKIGRAAADAARHKYEQVETEVLAAEGRRSIKAKVATVKRVARKAARVGAIAGTVAAASVVVREVRKRRKLT